LQGEIEIFALKKIKSGGSGFAQGAWLTPESISDKSLKPN
jgi:hypothetical protein